MQRATSQAVVSRGQAARQGRGRGVVRCLHGPASAGRSQRAGSSERFENGATRTALRYLLPPLPVAAQRHTASGTSRLSKLATACARDVPPLLLRGLLSSLRTTAALEARSPDVPRRRPERHWPAGNCDGVRAWMLASLHQPARSHASTLHPAAG